MLIRAHVEPLSAKADGKPPVLSSVSDRLCAKMIEADLMSRHVPLLRWSREAVGANAVKVEPHPWRYKRLERTRCVRS